MINNIDEVKRNIDIAIIKSSNINILGKCWREIKNKLEQYFLDS